MTTMTLTIKFNMLGMPQSAVDHNGTRVNGIIGFTLSCMTDEQKASVCVEDWTNYDQMVFDEKFSVVEIPAEIVKMDAESVMLNVEARIVEPDPRFNRAVDGIFILPEIPAVSAQI